MMRNALAVSASPSLMRRWVKLTQLFFIVIHVRFLLEHDWTNFGALLGKG